MGQAAWPGGPEAPRAIHWAGTASLGIIWGTAFMGMAVALDGFTPLWVAAGRLAIGALALLAVDAGLGRSHRPHLGAPVPWVYLLAIAFFATALPFALLTWGLQTVPSAFAGVSMATVAIFVLPLAHAFVPGEAMTWPRIGGVLLGFAGVVVLIGPGAFAGGGAAELLPGRLACLGAAGCYAIASVLTRLCPPTDAIRLSFWMTAGGAAMLLPVALAVDGVPPMPPALPLVTLIALGIFPTGLANLIRVLIVRSVGPGFMSLTAYQVPVWSVIFGAVILSEPIPPSMVTALALILAGIAMTQWRGVPSLRRPPPPPRRRHQPRPGP